MQITKREFLRKLGLGAVGAVASATVADEYVAEQGKLPNGAIGDPKNLWFAKHIYPHSHTIEDVPSSYLKDGKVIFPAREVPIFHETDVVVVGGGPAGFAAAVAAAKTGAKVALVEASGSLGGLFTNGMVLIMLSTCAKRDGKYEVVTRGICGEFMERALKLGGDFCTPDTTPRRHWQPTVDPEAAKYLMDRFVEENRIEMFFHAYGVDVIQDGNRVLGVVFQSKQGMQAILAKQTVDCTGDGDMFFAAGANYRQITHSIGFVTRLANMDRITAKDGPWSLRGNEGNPAVKWESDLGPKGDGLNVRDVSKAEVYHRKRIWEKVEKMRATPGWEKVFIANTCSQIGPRVTRLLDSGFIVDRKTLADPNYDPADCVGWFGCDGTIHDAFKLPYRSLVPNGVENLLVAGRSVGAPDTCDTFRLICPCFVMGEAAGTAAALCARDGVSPRNVDIPLLQKTLRSHNVYI